VGIHTLPLHFGKVLTGSEGGQSRPDLDIPRYTRMMKDGRFDLKKFITHRVKLEEVNQAIEQMLALDTVLAPVVRIRKEELN
jgi:S-(hydroxymethyl)glutathione dehydrogenase/alcohol dehydrogenase